MSMAYIRRTYGVPAKRGALVEYEGNLGTVTYPTHHVYVRFSGGRYSQIFHPLDLKWIVDGNGKAP